MKTFFYSLLIVLASVNVATAQNKYPVPQVYTNNFTTLVNEGDTLPGRDSLRDVGIRLQFSEAFLKYDYFMIEFHVISKSNNDYEIGHIKFVPASNEFKVKYPDRVAYDFWILNPNRKAGSVYEGDLRGSPPIVGGIYDNMTMLNKHYNNFYVVVVGYLKTGTQRIEYDEYGNPIKIDNYDDGTRLSRGITFYTKVKEKKKKKK